MPENRFFTDVDPLTPGDLLTLSKDEAHHLKKVMRARPNDLVEAVNGQGQLAQCRVLEGDQLLIQECEKKERCKKRLILAQALPKQANLELILQKGTEIGVDVFYLYPSARSERPSVSPSHQKRLESILQVAIKQCGRLYLPEITHFDALSAVPLKGATAYFGDLEATERMSKPATEDAILFIGPEGGFTEKELKYLRSNAKGITLSPHILRCETAAIVGSYALHSAMENHI